ncbi:hypothetical protein [Candidatus Magnetaquicoccus inordinatus]|uniref:hypothetical protein n=1 Tax=Candidatus Magnetaquicoccus inordinatus TaxID=2496818 RepID=UPI00102BBE04|nr:hypothetical protein [Candidatus Magnetaquicoccus inordinatus]
MLVIVVSQCLHKAWPRSRTVLDAYLERAGERTWRGRLTQDGLDRLRQELTAVATRQTAVAASTVTRNQRFDLEWIVGSAKPFAGNGQCTTYAGHAYDRYFTLAPARPALFSPLATVCELAGLWHDFGKANAAFQGKLRHGRMEADALRHEIISNMVFVRSMRALCAEADLHAAVVGRAIWQATRSLSGWSGWQDPIDLMPVDLPASLRLSAWLVATHHRLPDAQMVLDSIPECGLFTLTEHINPAKWPTLLQVDERVISDRLIDGTLRCVKSLLAAATVDVGATSTAYGRLALILADRQVSRQPFNAGWHQGVRPVPGDLCANYEWAKGVPELDGEAGEGRRPKQALDVHLQQVALQAPICLSDLFDMRDAAYALPVAGLPKNLRQRAPARYEWQNSAVVAVQAQRRLGVGFFAEIIAGTGAGKTRAAPKILAASAATLRYTLCLPLRALTLQAGRDYRQDVGFNDLEMITVIGASALRELYEKREENNGSETAVQRFGLMVDSTSANDLRGKLPDGMWKHLQGDPETARFLATPVVVATVDQLMAAADGRRTSYLVAALRLLSADLVLDEIDSYEAEDQIAIGRLLFLAGAFGRKVILSSATILQPHAQGLFRAYVAGYTAYAQFHGLPLQVDVGLFADGGEKAVVFAGEEEGAYQRISGQFRQSLAEELAGRSLVRSGRVMARSKLGDWQGLYEQMYQALLTLHQDHHVPLQRGKQRLSGLLVRLSHIDKCVAFVRWLAARADSDPDMRIIVYHSAFPLLMRDRIELFLDEAFKRKDKDRFPQHPRVQRWLFQSSRKDHILVIVTTAVEEIGRDHDFDGCLLEPTSEHSKTQAAGRVNRHRLRVVTRPNVYLLPTSLRAMQHRPDGLNYFRPGPEEVSSCLGSSRMFQYRLSSLWAEELFAPETIARMDARPHLLEGVGGEMCQLEYRKIKDYLLSQESPYSLYGYYREDVKAWLSGAHANKVRFRRSGPEMEVWFDRDEKQFYKRDEQGREQPIAQTIGTDPSPALSCRFLDLSADALFEEVLEKEPELAEDEKKRKRFFRRFFQLSLPNYEDSTWLYHPDCGVFRPFP